MYNKPIDEYIIRVVVFLDQPNTDNIKYENFFYLDNTNTSYFLLEKKAEEYPYKETKKVYRNYVSQNLLFKYNDAYIFDILSKNTELNVNIFMHICNRVGQSLELKNLLGSFDKYDKDTITFNIEKYIDLNSWSSFTTKNSSNHIQMIFENSMTIYKRKKKIFNIIN